MVSKEFMVKKKHALEEKALLFEGYQQAIRNLFVAAGVVEDLNANISEELEIKIMDYDFAKIQCVHDYILLANEYGNYLCLTAENDQQELLTFQKVDLITQMYIAEKLPGKQFTGKQYETAVSLIKSNSFGDYVREERIKMVAGTFESSKTSENSAVVVENTNTEE